MSSMKKPNLSQNETRKVARIMFSTIKKIGSFKGGSLKKIYEYLKAEYPSSKSNIMKLRKTLEKALALEGVNKKNRITFDGTPVLKSLKHRKQDGIIEAKRRSSRRKSRRRGRSSRRSRRRRKSPRRRSNNRI